MGDPNLLHHLRGAGLVLTLTPAGGLHVAPRDALTDHNRAAIRAWRGRHQRRSRSSQSWHQRSWPAPAPPAATCVGHSIAAFVPVSGGC